MRQTARLRLIRDRFVTGHDNCDLRRYLDSVPPETPIRDVVDRCRVWESHADPIARRMIKPTPHMTYPTYAVGEADKDMEVIKVAAVTGVGSDQNQLHDLLWWIVSAVERPSPAPEISEVKKLLLQLSRAPPEGPAPVVDTSMPPTLEQMLRDVLDGQRRRQREPQRQRQPPKQRPTRRDWSDVICFSYGKAGHAATHCPDYNDSLPFLQPGWQKEKTPGGFIMIPPRVAMDRQRAENGD